MNNDLISREALKELIENKLDERYRWDTKMTVCEFKTILEDVIDNAPTVELFCSYLSDREVKQPCIEGPCEDERPQGEWLKNANEIYKCSLCGAYGNPNYFRFCPNCGAKMKGGAE